VIVRDEYLYGHLNLVTKKCAGAKPDDGVRVRVFRT